MSLESKNVAHGVLLAIPSLIPSISVRITQGTGLSGGDQNSESSALVKIVTQHDNGYLIQ